MPAADGTGGPEPPGRLRQDGRVFMESDRQRRLIRITVWVAVLGLLLGVLSSIISAVAADAHAALRSITPGDGETVATAPRAVTLEFNEPIGTSFATVTVTGPSGDVSQGRPAVDATTVTQALSSGLHGRRLHGRFPGRERGRSPGLRHHDLHRGRGVDHGRDQSDLRADHDTRNGHHDSLSLRCCNDPKSLHGNGFR